MCEIAVLDPSKVYIETTQQLASNFYEDQGDGIGIVMVLNEGDTFRYETYKSTTPHWGTLYSFLKRYWDRAWRVIVHGRNATSGNVNRDTAHPIHVDCSECEFDYVVHNGSVRRYEDKQADLVEEGHHLNTAVDSEIIPHKVSTLPDDVSELSSSTYKFYGNLNYLLLSENGILARSDERYHLSDEFTMTCSPELFATPDELGFDTEAQNGWALIKPDGAEPEVTTKKRVAYKRGRNRDSRRGVSSRRWVAGQDAIPVDPDATVTESSGSEGSHTHTIEYADLSSFESITVIMVAPGVLKVIDDYRGETHYVKKNVDPRTYYYYVPGQQPENYSIDDLEKYAREAEDEEQGSQANLEDFQSEVVEEAIREEVSTTIAQKIDGVTIRDVAKVGDDLEAAISSGAEAAVAAQSNE